MGSLRSEAVDTITFTDAKNELKCDITFGKVKKRYNIHQHRPSDYFDTAIYHKGKAICTVDGTYCGYINFDKIRYWDGRFLKAFKVKIHILRLTCANKPLNPIIERERIFNSWDKESLRMLRKPKRKHKRNRERMSSWEKSLALKNDFVVKLSFLVICQLVSSLLLLITNKIKKIIKRKVYLAGLFTLVILRCCLGIDSFLAGFFTFINQKMTEYIIELEEVEPYPFEGTKEHC